MSMGVNRLWVGFDIAWVGGRFSMGKGVDIQ